MEFLPFVCHVFKFQGRLDPHLMTWSRRIGSSLVCQSEVKLLWFARKLQLPHCSWWINYCNTSLGAPNTCFTLPSHTAVGKTAQKIRNRMPVVHLGRSIKSRNNGCQVTTSWMPPMVLSMNQMDPLPRKAVNALLKIADVTGSCSLVRWGLEPSAIRIHQLSVVLFPEMGQSFPTNSTYGWDIVGFVPRQLD